jgi:hypothetical protein
MLPGQEPVSPEPVDDLPDGLIESVEIERQHITVETSEAPPPVGTTPPAALVAPAAQGQRGAAWRLLHWVEEDNPEAIDAIKRSSDQRLLTLLLEWLALGTWAGKLFRVPVSMRQPHFRAQISALFLPGSGVPEGLVKTVLCDGLHHPQPAVRETAAHLLGVLADPTTADALAEALHDPVSVVRVQAAKALGRLHLPESAPALVGALRYHDEAQASQVCQALAQLGSPAVPALLKAARSSDAWVRWHVLRVLGDLHDLRGMPALVEALADEDYAVAWMAARELATMGTAPVEEVLRLLIRAPDTPQLMETAGYVLHAQTIAQVKGILAPVLESMHHAEYRVAMPLAVQHALNQLAASGIQHHQG